MSNPPLSHAARDEWKQHWQLVIAATAGFSLHSVSIYAIGLVMVPLEQEFGWSRTVISMVTVVPAIFLVLFSPVLGAMIDRWGSRTLALASTLATGVSLALISLANGSITQWIGLWCIYGFLSLGVKMTTWSTVISKAFSAGRGLALGVTLCGIAIAQVIVPPLAQSLVDGQGWRFAYIALGLGWSIPCFVLVYFLLRDPVAPSGPETRSRTEGSAPQNDIAAGADDLRVGLTFPQALRSSPLIRIGLSTLLTMFIGTAILVHQVPILTNGGVARSEAAWLASLAGVAGLIGKLATGWMVDRWHAALVGAISLIAPVISYVILLYPSQPVALNILAMMIIGYTAGSKLQISAYLTGRYAGMLHYGKIFGVMSSLIAIGGGLGSVAAGAIYDLFGSYQMLLVFGIGSSIVCGLLLVGLGPYPNFQEPSHNRRGHPGCLQPAQSLQ